ncbi:MAG TPA: SRPBCC family protein [Solirubrobacteraceae bacterium]|nr:SRPBCC family protein [Solirubrobacteraceae bacterium]
MPTARRSRSIAAPAQELWELLLDPHHLPRWWPRVTRVEDVEEDAFTEVMRTRKGKLVRADFDVRRDEAQRTITWIQRIDGTPFASVLRSAETELRLTPTSTGGTEVTIELRQQMAGGSDRRGPGRSLAVLGVAPRFGAPLVRRAAGATLEEALDGLERVSG